MSFNLAQLQADFPDLDSAPLARPLGATGYRLRLPPFIPGREFAWAELQLPKGFPEMGLARVVLSPDTILRIPHVEISGALCLPGDPGVSSGLSANDRILRLLIGYQEQFLEPWQKGELDGDFAEEPLNYWDIRVAKTQSPNDAVTAVWTLDPCPIQSRVREGWLVLPKRIVLVGDTALPLMGRVIQSLGTQATQQRRVLIAEIPISHPLIPAFWPRTTADLERILEGRLASEEYARFHETPGRRRGIHRIALLRHHSYGFAFLLPGWPPTEVYDGKRRKSYPSRSTLLPLVVVRLDPAWTVGRDQHPEEVTRQAQHALVLGAGALGSTVVDHLAKAGVGRITLVDADDLASANLGRHLLGAEALGQSKAKAVAQRVNRNYPATRVEPVNMTAQRWLRENTLDGVDLVLDLTGEREVRWVVDQARRAHPCPWLIGWMEPFVAAAHICCLSAGTPWWQDEGDVLHQIEAVGWPDEVIRQEPGCSSRFQSYTATAAAYAVALVAEQALGMLDSGIEQPQVVSWVRGQSYLDKHWPGLALREWARSAAPHDGLLIRRDFP